MLTPWTYIQSEPRAEITPQLLHQDVAFAVGSVAHLTRLDNFLRNEVLLHSLGVAVRECYPGVKLGCFRMIADQKNSAGTDVVLPVVADKWISPAGVFEQRDIASVLSLVYPGRSPYVGIGSSQLRHAQGPLVAALRGALQSAIQQRELRAATQAPDPGTPQRPRL